MRRPRRHGTRGLGIGPALVLRRPELVHVPMHPHLVHQADEARVALVVVADIHRLRLGFLFALNGQALAPVDGFVHHLPTLHEQSPSPRAHPRQMHPAAQRHRARPGAGAGALAVERVHRVQVQRALRVHDQREAFAQIHLWVISRVLIHHRAAKHDATLLLRVTLQPHPRFQTHPSAVENIRHHAPQCGAPVQPQRLAEAPVLRERRLADSFHPLHRPGRGGERRGVAGEE